MSLTAFWRVAVLVTIGCGPTGAPTRTPPSASTVTIEEPRERSFEELIDDAIGKERVAVDACVADARARRDDSRADIRINIGIERDGTLIGAKPPEGELYDEGLASCLVNALRATAFPTGSRAVLVSIRFPASAAH